MFLSFSFLIIFLSFPPFSISSLSFFLVFYDPIFISLFAYFVKPSCCLHHILFIRYSCLSSILLLSCIISVIHLCKLFSFIHSDYCSVVISVSFPFYLYFLCFFPFLKVVIVFFQHAAILIEREREIGRNMHDKGTKRNTNDIYPFARPLLHWAARCMYRP